MPTLITRGALSARGFGMFGGGLAAWGTPTSLGTGTNSAGGTIILSTVTAPVGSMVVVLVAEANTAAGSVTDSAGNTYTLAKLINGNPNAQIFYSSGIAALASGTITYTKAASGSNVVISAFYITGAAASPLDLATTGTTGTSTSPSITSAAPAVVNELFVTATQWAVASQTLTQDTNHAWAAITLAQGNSLSITGGTFVNTGSGALTYAPTISASETWKQLLVSFKHA